MNIKKKNQKYAIRLDIIAYITNELMVRDILKAERITACGGNKMDVYKSADNHVSNEAILW